MTLRDNDIDSAQKEQTTTQRDVGDKSSSNEVEQLPLRDTAPGKTTARKSVAVRLGPKKANSRTGAGKKRQSDRKVSAEEGSEMSGEGSGEGRGSRGQDATDGGGIEGSTSQAEGQGKGRKSGGSKRGWNNPFIAQ